MSPTRAGTITAGPSEAWRPPRPRLRGRERLRTTDAAGERTASCVTSAPGLLPLGMSGWPTGRRLSAGSSHALRHPYSAEMAREGTPMKVLRDALGHDSSRLWPIPTGRGPVHVSETMKPRAWSLG